MKKISPRDFHDAFVAVMKAEHASFRTAVGFESKSYKYFMRSTIYPKIAKLLGLLSWNKEYLALDGMLYEERGADAFDNYTSYVKWISVAVEHEHNSSKTHETVNKLQMYNVPLKVLIAYASEGDDTDALLRRYEGIIRDADPFDDIATLRQQLVILGTPKTVRQWRFYVYENGGFVLLLPIERE